MFGIDGNEAQNRNFWQGCDTFPNRFRFSKTIAFRKSEIFAKQNSHRNQNARPNPGQRPIPLFLCRRQNFINR